MNQGVEEKTRVLAEKLLGWKLERPGAFAWWGAGDMTMLVADWNPYESIADAFMVLEKVREWPDNDVRWDRFVTEIGLASKADNVEFGFVSLDPLLRNLTPAMIADAALAAIEVKE